MKTVISFILIDDNNKINYVKIKAYFLNKRAAVDNKQGTITERWYTNIKVNGM